MEINTVIQGDCLEVLKTLPDESVDCCVTSPPYYGLRDYGTGNKQIGLEETPEEYISKLVSVFREVRRCLKDDGTLWLNIGDSYWGSGSRGYDFTGKLTEASGVQSGSKGTENLSNIPKLVGKTDTGIKNKDLVGIPWMLAFALRADGWYLRQDIIWAKKNCMPESVKDRCTRSHEYIFLLSKKLHYYFDYEAIQEPAVCADDKRAHQDRIEYDGKRTEDNHTGAQKSFVAFSHKNLQYNGQQNHSMHERRAEGLPDVDYVVRNKRDVWRVSTKAVKEAHFATFPEELVKPCILAGCVRGGDCA